MMKRVVIQIVQNRSNFERFLAYQPREIETLYGLHDNLNYDRFLNQEFREKKN